ncbi:MAG: ABC transporter ATP-binding protein [Isoptericola variabilis]|uniref:ATP-binding cassette domain-containing protein n=1 Tax=Actinomycetes TaxID=1760 RepID=UPI0006604191|nr:MULTISPECIES: ABC transporter ATP-binding protein [Actinomycetes]MBF1253891.1 ABC transporter ATP-binding protein [Isoptericola variabilis]MBS6969264.1 ABC transporter ATP-binding protein [Actinomyces sp.]MDK7159739.1 ABC transporter ATP-binding protein [Pauljensenia sp. UMB3104]
MITLNSIRHTYPGENVAALRDISLTLGDATVTALVGPNGSGKTTLMQILGGLMVPTAGSISIDGSQASADDLLTGSIVASSARDLDDANSKTLVAYARLRPTWDEQLFEHYVDRFELALSRKSVRKLSSGQAAIFSASIALASGAPLTLLDEIQAPLDVPTRYALYEEILALAGEVMEGQRPQRRFLISSHMVSELEKVAEDVIVLKKGELLAHESVDDFTARVTSVTGHASDVERFLGERPTLAVIASRELGSTREIVVDLRGASITEADLATHSLSAAPCSFQDAFAYLIQENDQ